MAGLKYATKAQLVAAIRERFASSAGPELHRLSAKIKTAMDAGEFTDEEMRMAFGKSTAQWAALKGKITTYATRYSDMHSARGE